MGILVRAVRHGYRLRVASRHPQHAGQPEAVTSEPEPVGYVGICWEVEAVDLLPANWTVLGRVFRARLGGAEDNEGFEVFGRPKGVHSQARRRRRTRGVYLPEGGN